MDTPQLAGDQLTAFDPERFDACLGLAPDGGYWVIGFRDPAWAGAAIRGVPMSTAHTGAAQLERLRGLGLRVQLLDELTDVDTIDSADEVALLAPDSHFAIALAAAGRGRRMRAGALAPYEQALRATGRLGLHTAAGEIVELDVARWLAGADDADDTVLDRCTGPVLDIGCGPGRFVSSLNARGRRGARRRHRRDRGRAHPRAGHAGVAA